MKRPIFQTLMGGFSPHFIKLNYEFTFQLSVISLSQLCLFCLPTSSWLNVESDSVVCVCV